MAEHVDHPNSAGMLSARFAEAFAFAFEVHREQTKKGTPVPYIAHLLEVAGLVLDYGGREDEAIAALLHDAVEDHPDAVSFGLLRQRFGAAVASIVESCSDSSVNPKPPWKPRKEKYIAHLADADESVMMVAAADKLANARAVLKDYREAGEKVWGRFNAGKEEQLWYYRAVTDVLLSKASSGRAQPLVQELQRAVKELETTCSI